MSIPPELDVQVQADPADLSSSQCEWSLVFSNLYKELHRLATSASRKEANLEVTPTTLVHETWLKLKESPIQTFTSDVHFKAIAAKAMRQIVVDEARRKHALKRGGNCEPMHVTLSEFADTTNICEAELLDLDSALQELRSANPRQAEVVESRFFGGLSAADIAGVLGISVASVERDWRVARAWLRNRIRPCPSDSGK